jgi:hypothetical protein
MNIEEILKTKQVRMTKTCFKEWKVTTTFELGDSLLLSIVTTRGSSRILTTRVSVDHISEDRKSTIHALFSDFSIQLHESSPSRVTEKITSIQHDLVDEVAAITKALAFYVE